MIFFNASSASCFEVGRTTPLPAALEGCIISIVSYQGSKSWNHFLRDAAPGTRCIAHFEVKDREMNPEKTYQTRSLDDNVIVDFIDMSSSFFVTTKATITRSLNVVSSHEILSVYFAFEMQVIIILSVRDTPMYLLPSSSAAAFDGPKTGIGIALVC